MERAFCRFAIQDLETMERPLRKSVWKIVPVFGAIGFLVAAGGAGGWFYYSFRLRDVPPLPRAPQALRSIAKIMAAPQPSTSPNTSAPIEPSSSPSNVPERPVYHLVERHHVEDFREDMKKKVLDELAPSFPELPLVLNDRQQNTGTAPYERAVFQLLDAEKNAPLDRRPAILFAADVAASHLGCVIRDAGDLTKGDCARLRGELARRNLTLAYDELGAGSYYPHDLLWRIWREYRKRIGGSARSFCFWITAGTAAQPARKAEIKPGK